MRKKKDINYQKHVVELKLTYDEDLNVMSICKRNYLDLSQVARIAIKHLLSCPEAHRSKVLDLPEIDLE